VGAVQQVNQWGRWWLDTTRPYTLNIEATPGHTIGILLSDLRNEGHRQRWISLVVIPTLGITPRDLEDLEGAVKALQLCFL
jgi:hypothetical protein